MNRVRVKRIAPAAAAMLMLAGSTLAQQVQIIQPPGGRVFIRPQEGRVVDPEAPARLARLINELNTGDFKARTQADRELFDDQAITLPMIEQALKDHGAQSTMDTRLRLTSAARVRFMQTPRAAMGIQFWQNRNLISRVVIERTFPEFKASKSIQEGDMIVEADGVVLKGPLAQRRLQSLIVSHDPGDVIPITVRRGAEKMDFKIELGERQELPNAAFVDPNVLERAWRTRSASYVAPGSDPIVPPVTAKEWNANPLPAMRVDRATARAKGVVGLGPSVVGGGMPRGADQAYDPLGQQVLLGNLRGNGQIIFNNGQMWIAQQFDPMLEPDLPTPTPQQELTELVRARTQAAGSLAQNRNARKPVPDGQLDILKDFVARDVAMIDKQIAAIKAEMTEAGIAIPESLDGTAAQGQTQDRPPDGAP